MNKIYILMVNGITGMGGGQMYTYNKSIYMREQGWSSIVLSGHSGKVYIEPLKEFEKYIVPELVSSPIVYTKKDVEIIISKILELLNLDEFDDCIIESGSPHMALWGEVLAKKLHARHIIYMLEERPDHLIPLEYLPFYSYKYERNELTGISPNTLSLLFRDTREIDKSNFLSAPCRNVIADYYSETIDSITYEDKGILIFGRMDKPFVYEAFISCCKLAQRLPERKFDIFFIGDSDNSNIKKRIKSSVGNQSNISIHYLGYIFPVPREIFKHFDLVISSAGSAGVSYECGAKTISIDGNDLMAIGVLGYTTLNTLYRKEEELLKIDELLESVLFTNYLESYSFIPRESLDGNERLRLLKCFDTFLNKCSESKEYYDVYQLKPKGNDLRKHMIRVILGKNNYLRIRPLINKIRGK